jgi:hypothetical protein
MGKSKEKIKYRVNKQVFFNWYFKNQPKEQISVFLSPYLLGLVNKDAQFGLQDILNSTDTIPSSILLYYKGSVKQIKSNTVELV